MFYFFLYGLCLFGGCKVFQKIQEKKLFYITARETKYLKLFYKHKLLIDSYGYVCEYTKYTFYKRSDQPYFRPLTSFKNYSESLDTKLPLFLDIDGLEYQRVIYQKQECWFIKYEVL